LTASRSPSNFSAHMSLVASSINARIGMMMIIAIHQAGPGV
jgi:hypothetical protein